MKNLNYGRMALSASLGLLLIACSETVQFSTAPGFENLSSGMALKDTFYQGVESKKLDILFVVDNSGSMADEQAKLSDRIDRFIDTLEDVEWRIGITTTDVSNGAHGLRGRLLPFDSSGRMYIEPSTPNHLEIFKNTIVRQESITCLPECPSGNEEALGAALLAIEKRDAENRGFFRAGADLGLLVLTDEDERSTGPLGAVSAAQLLNGMRRAWADTKRLLTYGIIIEPGDEDCLAENAGQGRYGTFVATLAAVTGGLVGSICEEDYAPTLGEIANHARRLLDYVELRAAPADGSVDVSFDPPHETDIRVEGRRVYFVSPPVKGTKIEIDYTVQ